MKTAKNSLSKKILDRLQENPSLHSHCFVGFDGFTDEILAVVEKRTDEDHYSPLKQMDHFGKKVLLSAGKSCNMELVVKQIRLGGNAPILANALLEGGHKVTFVGAIGEPGAIEPLFQKMASRCETVVTLAPSGHTDALEFQDGKILMGKLESLKRVNYENLKQLVGKEKLISLLEKSDLMVSANWTMLPHMTEIWRSLTEEVLPHLSKRKRFLFVDIADPAKRLDKDLKEAIHTLENMKKYFYVILGLNQAESERVASVYACSPSAEAILKETSLDQIVIHATKYAEAADKKDSITVNGPYTENPLLVTGAGDNFNAGFCHGLLLNFSMEECLICGVFTSGYYVRNAKSPTLIELAKFITEYYRGLNS